MDMQELLNNMARRNITAYCVPCLDAARDKILDMLPPECSVGIGNSVTVKDLGLAQILKERGNTVLDKTAAASAEEARKLKKQALLADWYISGSNAISMEGHIVNIDHSGNRTAAMLFGPDRVIIVAGKNKLVPTLEAAIERVRNHAAPQNARRAGMNPPCTEIGKCIDCRHPERVCNNLLVIEGQADLGRMTVIIVDEERGF